MKFLMMIAVALGLSISLPALSKVKVENVKVHITEKNKDPVTVTIPYWVAKAGSEVTDLIKVNEKDIDMKKILNLIENAPQLGTIMTIEEKNKKVVISIE